jgi:hypothetical protein
MTAGLPSGRIEIRVTLAPSRSPVCALVELDGHLQRPPNRSGWSDNTVANADVPRTTAHDLRHTALTDSAT